jgi:hypothetical protein
MVESASASVGVTRVREHGPWDVGEGRKYRTVARWVVMLEAVLALSGRGSSTIADSSARS